MRLITVDTEKRKEKKEIEKILSGLKLVSYKSFKIDKCNRFEILTTKEISGPLIEKIQKLGFGKSFKKGITIQTIEGSLPLLQKKEITPVISQEELATDISTKSKTNWIYLSFISVAAIIITLGLLDNNGVVIIGGMLIAPLLYPLIGTSFYAYTKNRSGLRKSILSEMWGVALPIFWGLLIAYMIPNLVLTQEVVSRGIINFYMVGVAVFAGVAGALSVTTKTLESLSGVAIAAALLPPAVTVGIGIGAARMTLATNALGLTAINILAVHLMSMIVFKVLGYK